MSRYIHIVKESGETFPAYVATPASGIGPGLVLLHEVFGMNDWMRDMADLYAQEGYVVLMPDLFWRAGRRPELSYDEAGAVRGLELRAAMNDDLAVADIGDTLRTLRALPAQTGGVGVIGYGLGGLLAYLTAVHQDVDVAISYCGVGVHEHLDEADGLDTAMVFHLAELDSSCPEPSRSAIRDAFAGDERVRVYDYAGAGHGFATHGRGTYAPTSAGLAYSRTLTALRAAVGPYFDLATIWDEHIRHEFETRDVRSTMATMIAEPYVNHIPTMTGGVGQKNLSRFYAHHFMHANPADTKAIPVSRTVSADRIVEEIVFSCTHDREIDWLLPGVPPTGKFIELPMVLVVTFRGNKVYNEHIYWDQASVLVQIGLLDPTGLPVSGVEQSRKLLDETLPSNELMPSWPSSEGKPIA
jgi:carboxymethylenebutenolidase